MLQDSKYVVYKAIPLDPQGNEVIKEGTEIIAKHGVVYMNGGLVSPDWQEDFRMLIETERARGFDYLRPDNPIVGKSII